MHQFTLLYTACTDRLPAEESLKLYHDVISQDDSPECDIDVSMIVSRAEAKKRQIKPVCDHDMFPICQQMLSTGAHTCKVDYCEICAEVGLLRFKPPRRCIPQLSDHVSH
jgi:hypothetical protein